MGAKPVELADDIKANLRRWDKQGIPRREMSRRTGVSLYHIINFLGKKPKRPRGDTRPDHHIYAHHEPFRRAAKIAESLGYRLTAGDNAGKGSVGALIEGIGKGEVHVVPLERLNTLIAIESRWNSRDA